MRIGKLKFNSALELLILQNLLISKPAIIDRLLIQSTLNFTKTCLKIYNSFLVRYEDTLAIVFQLVSGSIV